jgi:hypothetical protein
MSSQKSDPLISGGESAPTPNAPSGSGNALPPTVRDPGSTSNTPKGK